MYQLAISRDFIARHYLVGGDWGAENQQHSHHYRIEIQIEHDRLDSHGYLVDIVDLENALTGVIDRFKDVTLNDLSEFEGINPSLEHFARIIHNALRPRLDFGEQKLTVKLWENERDWAAYRE